MHEILSVWLHAFFHPAGQPLSFSDPRSSGSQRHPRGGAYVDCAEQWSPGILGWPRPPERSVEERQLRKCAA